MGDLSWEKLKHKTMGAFAHLLEKFMSEGFWPVGFCVVWYKKDAPPEKRWRHSPYVLFDSKSIDLHEKKLQKRIELVNQFLAEGVKRILEGEIDEMFANKEDIGRDSFYVPGVKGKA